MTDATLRLDTTTLSGRPTYEAPRVATAWTETGLTWSSQPATSEPTTTATTGGSWVTWSVTAQVAAMHASGNYGLRIKDSVDDTGATSTDEYSSHEGATRPSSPCGGAEKQVGHPSSRLSGGRREPDNVNSGAVALRPHRRSHV